jgi:hypothetical protein
MGISELESYLESTLRPVSPRQDFIDDLRRQLDHTPSEYNTAFSIFQITVAVLAVAVGGMLLFFSLIRMMVSIVRTIRDRRGSN